LILKADAPFASRQKNHRKRWRGKCILKSPTNQQQMLAYREMTDDDLFTTQWVKVELPPQEFPGYKGERIVCDSCGEGINFRREVRRNGKVLCRSCAGARYYEPA
jgi:formylmethanofuran dehydrogenase subunit E